MQRDHDQRHFDDRFSTPMGLNPFLFEGFPKDYDWTVLDGAFDLANKTQDKVEQKSDEAIVDKAE
jgi:hypothetical protein